MLGDDDAIKNKARLVNNFEEKVREKIVKICETRSRSQNSVIVNPKTVMLILLYGVLMMLVITIKPNANGLVK